jgi:TolA-binding protein
MNKYLLFLLVVSSSIAGAQEVSVFDADNLNANNPYGLNSSEKHILKNQTSINTLSSKVGDMNSLIEAINRRLEGLESTYEGDSAKLNSTALKINELSQKMGQSSDLASKNGDAAEIKNVSDQLLNMNSESEKEMKESINTLKTAVSKISTLVNKINSDYVSSAELEKNMQQFITREEFEALKKSMGVKTSQVTPNKTTESKSSGLEDIKKDLTADDKVKLLNDAKKDFDAKNYNSASPKYEKLVEINYKPAESNYYLGEMWYIRKKYDLAISHFKKSAVLNDKAAYMPTLLLHSAISFENTKDKDNAKSFYSTLIDLYPDSSESKIAKKNLTKL